MANQKYAHVIDGTVIEIAPDGVTPAENYHPDIAQQFIACPAKVKQGWIYEGKTFAAPVAPPLTREQLISYAADKRWQVETGGIVIEGMPITTDRESQSMISSAFQVAFVTGQTIKFKSAGGFVELSPGQMKDISLTVAAHVQASFATEAAVLAAIEGGEITTTDQIDACAWPSNGD